MAERDINDVRDVVRRVSRGDLAGEDAYFDRFARSSLVSAFNRFAPAELTLPTDGPISLEVTSHLAGRLPSQDLALLENAFSRAVAFVGASIAHPDADALRISDRLFRQSPIYTRPTASGAVVFLPQRVESLPGMDGDSIAERAMVRLASLLPDVEGSASPWSVLAMRQSEVRAVREVVAVAKPLVGLDVLLRGGEEVVRSRMTSTQAEDLEDLLSDMQEHVEQLAPLSGRLDGVRFRRQMFYLELASGTEIQGIVDAPLLARTRELLDTPVMATLERVTKTRIDGSRTKAAYRLIGVEQAPPEPGLFD